MTTSNTEDADVQLATPNPPDFVTVTASLTPKPKTSVHRMLTDGVARESVRQVGRSFPS